MDPEPQAGLETGLQHGSKVHPETEANTGLETIYKVHSGCPTLKADPYSTAPRRWDHLQQSSCRD